MRHQQSQWLSPSNVWEDELHFDDGVEKGDGLAVAIEKTRTKMKTKGLRNEDR
jgi:hypothetical protein